MIVLDGYTLNPGDLSWDSLTSLAPAEIYDRTAPEQVLERAGDAEIVLTNKTRLPEEIISRMPSLRYIGVLATGYDVVDITAARALGIIVTNVPTYSTASVSQFVFALLLELCHYVQQHSDAVRAGAWSQCKDFSFWQTPLVELEGKTIGIIGWGKIGQEVARIASAFGMRVVAYSRSEKQAPDYSGFRWLGLEDLLCESDVVSLHCPLTPETRGIINAARLRMMKPTSFLLNTSRGPLIVEQDLADALNEGRLAGAAVDVLLVEPPPGSPLFTARNCLVTPHMAWATREARSRLMHQAVENVRAFLNGKPSNVVS